MKKTYILIALFLTSLISYGQYSKAKIELKDGTVKEGFIKKIKVKNDNIFFKATKKDKEPVEIISADILKIIVFDKKDESVFFEYHYIPVNRYISKSGAIKFKEKTIWVQLRVKGYMSLYHYEKKSSYFDNNISMSRSTNQKVYYAIREGEKVATNVGVNTMNGYYLKRDGAKYFSDYPELSKKLKKKTKGYRIKNILQIVDEYNAWKSSN